MKKFILALLIANLVGCAGAQSQDEALGALIGGTLGYVFGDGSGHQKEIAAGGAVLGAILASNDEPNYNRGYPRYRPNYWDPSYIDSTNRPVSPNYHYSRSYNSTYSYRRYCRSQVPQEYYYNSGAAESWISGCVEREAQRQQEVENRAYREGYSQ